MRKTFVRGLGTVSTTRVLAPHVRIAPLLAHDREAKLFEIPIKAEADHVIEEHGDHDKRDGITPRQLFIAPQPPKDLLRVVSDRVIVRHKTEGAVPLSRETGFSPWEEGRDTKVVLRDSRYGL